MPSFRYYFSIFLRRFPWFLIVAGVISGVAITVAKTLPPAFESEVRMIVESAQIPGQLAESTVQMSAAEQLQLFETRLLTRANMLDIARRLKVLDEVQTMSPDLIVAAMRARTTIRSSTGRNEATLMTIKFEAGTPQKAAAVLNEYLTLILREDAEFRAARAGQTQEFFEQEVAQLGEELSNQSAKILQFKNQHANALPESLDYRRGQQLTQQERLLQLDREINALKEQKQRLTQIFESTGRIETGTARTPDQIRLARLEQELNQALSIYSDVHPKVRSLRAQIDQLQQQINAAGNTAPAPEAGADDAAKAMFNLQLAEIDARIDLLEQQKVQAQKLLDELTESISLTPANAIALDALERDYANVQNQYNQAVDRLARASTGERIESLSRGQRITVVEQPTVPSEPTKPNRLLIAGGGTFLGIAAGLALVVGLEFLNRTARRPADLVNRLGITPIATIPYLRTRRQKFLRRASLVALVLIIGAAIPAGIYALHTYYMPLDLIADRVMNKLGVRG